ncbi:hypothetical protein C8J56DRAFT_164383 [Mycena floridula]|nr:hypothetical protein C8J56DRAFT_164383 [Mycena floridula]
MSNRPRSIWHLTGDDRFTGKDYQKFWTQLLDEARPLGLIQYFKGTVKVPAEIYAKQNPPVHPSTPTPTSIPAADAAKSTPSWFHPEPTAADYIERDAVAQSMVRLSCRNSRSLGIPDEERDPNVSAVSIFAFLEAKYVGQGELERVEASRALRSVHLEQNGDYEEFEKDLISKWDSALAAGCDIKDSEFRSILIAALPRQYDTIIDMLDNVSDLPTVQMKLRNAWMQ